MPATARARDPDAGTNVTQDCESFIEVQFPVSKLSKECYKERKANAGQTLTALGSYWKGRKPLILVRAVVLGLIMPKSNDVERDREIFLKLMLMDDDGLLKRRKPFDRKLVARVMELLPTSRWTRAIGLSDKGHTWTLRSGDPIREAVELEAFAKMGRDEKLRHCLRPEELAESTLDDAWDEVNDHLGTNARSISDLIGELGERRFGRRPRVGDPFCGGGSIPFEAARIGCDVYASDLNPIACLLTWGALNIVGGTAETRETIATAQKAIVAAVDAKIVKLGFEHDGSEGDLRLPVDVPTSWPHGYRVTRKEVVEPEAAPYTVTCPKTGWRVPMIATRQVLGKPRAVLELVPEPKRKTYRITTRSDVDDETWEVAAHGTVVRADDEFFLVHDTGEGETRVRIANRAKAYLYCIEVLDPATGWRVPLAPSWIISKNYTTVATLVPNKDAHRFDIVVKTDADEDDLEAAASGTTDGDGNVVYAIDGKRHTVSLESLRGDVQVLSTGAYDSEEQRERAVARLGRCRNRYGETSGNDLRLWELSDVVPRPDDLYQERLYAVQWFKPDGTFLFTEARPEDVDRDSRVQDLVQTKLSEWQAAGLVPNSRIEPGEETLRLIRERGWTHWHHLFTPRHLLIGALIRGEIKAFDNAEAQMGLSIGFAAMLNFMSRLCQWLPGFPGGPGVAPSADTVKHVFYNQALNTFLNFGGRSFASMLEAFRYTVEHLPAKGEVEMAVLPAGAIEATSDLWITDPPYADAVHYHECEPACNFDPYSG